MGAGQGTALRLIDDEIELLRETRDFARWALADVMQLQKRFFKTHGLAITESCFDDLLLFKASDAVSSKEIFRVLDTNKDGRIDGLEFLAALICVCRASFEEKARFAFELFDFNSNGSLSLTELALLMKSVWIGMALLTGHSIRLEDSTTNAADPTTTLSAAASVATKFLRLAQAAFKRYDRDGGDSLQYEEFIEWARSNREFMLQVEQFRLISEKAVGFEEVLSLPDGSDVDSDLDDEELFTAASASASAPSNQSSNASARASELPAPWIIEPTRSLSSDPTVGDFPPPANLELDWIYGYTGPQTRSTVRVLATGDIVYVVSKYAIVYTPTRHAQRHYCGHRAPITCLDMNAAATLLATGDARDCGPEIHVWSGVTLECLAVLSSFHVDGLAGLSFPAPTILQQVAPIAGASTGAASSAVGAAGGGERGGGGGGGGGSGGGNASAASKKQHHDAESLLVSVGSDANASMALWDWQQERLVASGRAVHKWRRVLCVALSEDGSEIVVAGAHFVVFHQVTGRFFKTKKPKLAHDKLSTMPLCLSATYVGPHTVVVGTARGELLQLQHHRLVRVVQAHGVAQSVNVCVLSCRSMVLFTAGKDGVVKQWDSTLQPIGNALDLHRRVLPAAGASALQDDDLRVHSLAYDASRQRLVVGTRHGRLFQVLEATEPLQVRLIASSHEGGAVHALATCRVGLCFATCSASDQRLRLWSVRRRVEQQQLRLRFVPSALVYSSDGDLLAVGGRDGSIALFKAKSLTLLAQIRNTTAAVRGLRFHPSPTQLMLAVACANGLVYLYDIEGGAYRFHRHALLKPERSLASGDGGGDGDDRDESQRVSLDFSVDGRFLKTQHGRAGLRFWDLKDHAALRVTNMAVVRNVQWQSFSSTQGWHVSALRESPVVALSASADQSLAATLDSDGSLALRHFPCAQRSTRTLAKTVARVHYRSSSASPSSSSALPPPAIGFALHDALLLSTGCEHGSVVCQWRVRACVADEQPRRPALSSSALWRHLARFGQQELYAQPAVSRPRAPLQQQQQRHVLESAASAVVAPTPLTAASSVQTMAEAPDLDLSMAFVVGMNRRLSTLNQTLAVVLHTSARGGGGGGGSTTASVQPLLIYGAGTQLVALHVALGTQQSATVSGLQHQISSVVSHVGLSVVAVASRRDCRVQLWQWTPNPQIIATLPAPTSREDDDDEGLDTAQHVLTAFHDCDELPHTSPSRDLVAVVWRRADSVLLLRFHRWRVTQRDGAAVCLAQAEMTRLPVLLGFFYAASSPLATTQPPTTATTATFVSGGVDHVTFWRLHVATGHVTSQPGVFGRHALVDTAVCGTHVAPYVLTGMARGAIVVWDDGVAGFSLQLAPADHADVAVQSLVAVPSRQQLLAGLSTGEIHVLAYAHEPDATRYRANAFLSRVQTLQLSDCAWRWPLATATTASSSQTPPSPPTKPHAALQSLLVLDDLQHGVVVQLATGETLHIDESALSASSSATAKTPVARVLVDTGEDITSMAVHPREHLVALGHPSARLSLVALDSRDVVADLRELSTSAGDATVKALAWHPLGDTLVASLSSGALVAVGLVLQPKTTTLERRGNEVACGAAGATNAPPKWCWTLRFSSLPPSTASTVWLAAACRDYHIYVYKATGTTADGGGVSLELAHDFSGHTAPVRSLDFSSDGRWLQSSTSSIDRQLLRWELQPEGPDRRPHSELSDAEWASWSSPFAGPVAGLQEVFHSSVTAVTRIHSVATEPPWQSPLPTIALGTETGRLLLGWYPLPCGESKTAMFKEYSGFLGRHAVVRDLAFSGDNAVLVVLATCHDGAGVVLLWRTDYDEELRHRERLQTQRPAPVRPLPPPADVVCETMEEPAPLLDAFLAKSDAARAAGDEFLAVQPWLGAVREPSVLPPGAATSGASPPDADLALEFVYGVNPAPVWYADDAWEIVYSAASFGVVYNTKTRAQLRNAAHGGRLISCVAVHPRGDLVVTGEIAAGASASVARKTPPRLVAWDANSGSTVAQIETIHGRGIALLAFAPSGQRVASVGMDDDHVLALYALSGDGMPQFKLLASMKTSKQPVHALCFHDQRDDELVTAGTRHVLFWSTASAAPAATTTVSGRRHGAGGSHSASGGGGGAGAGAVALSMKKGLLGTDRAADAVVLSAAFVAWHPQQSSVVTGHQDGSLRVWKARQCVDTFVKAHDRAVQALRVDPKRPHVLYSAGLDGRIAVWTAKLERLTVVDLEKLQPDGGNRLFSVAVKSLCVRDDRVLFSTAGGDVGELVERVMSPPSRSAGATNTAVSYRLHVHVQSHCKGELWGLAAHPQKLLFVTAGDDGSVRLWDAATRCLSAVYTIGASKKAGTSAARCRAVAFSSDGSHVAVGLVDGQVVVLNEALDAVIATWKCSNKAIAVLRYDPVGRFLAIGAHDQAIHVVDAHSYKPLGVCRGHSATVSHLDFSKDGRVLQSTSNAGELLFWQVPPTAEGIGKTATKRGATSSVFAQIPSATSVRDTTWATWSVPYGWSVQGIWAAGADGSDVNAVCRSADGMVVATGDDNGLVKLFRYPSVVKAAAHKAFVGHASHVTNCVFSRHDSVLLTAGGLDNTVCQFKYLAVAPASSSTAP